jgi:hypothetical protein
MEDPQTPNPKAASSTATRARRRPAVGRPAPQPPELQKTAGEGRVTFLFDLLLFLFFPFQVAASSNYLVFSILGGPLPLVFAFLYFHKLNEVCTVGL